MDQSYADQGLRFDWNGYFTIVELLAATPEWLHAPYATFAIPSTGLQMWEEKYDAKYVMELPLAHTPEWCGGKDAGKRQFGRFEALLFAPDLIRFTLRLECLLKTLFPGAYITRRLKRDKTPNHAVMWRIRVTVGYLHERQAPPGRVGQPNAWVADPAKAMKHRAQLTIGVTSERHEVYGNKARCYFEGGAYSIDGTPHKFMRYVTRVLITEVIEQVLRIDTRPEVLLHQVGGSPTYVDRPPPRVIAVSYTHLTLPTNREV